jgi:hypothetical protein
VRVAWDAELLRYLWNSQEEGTAQFPFLGLADITGLEPGSASFSDGLPGAIGRGGAWTGLPGDEVAVSVALELVTVEKWPLHPPPYRIWIGDSGE